VAQVAFVDPIADLFNPPYGMDIGFQLGVLFAGIAELSGTAIEVSSNTCLQFVLGVMPS
jgi:hypothetical protein